MKRVVPAPFEIENERLPRIDFILVSHNHYDHLDYGSVSYQDNLGRRMLDLLRLHLMNI